MSEQKQCPECGKVLPPNEVACPACHPTDDRNTDAAALNNDSPLSSSNTGSWNQKFGGGAQVLDSPVDVLESASESVQPGISAHDLDRFGHYQLIQEIGRGGMGVVYRARDERLNRTVAVKLMHAHLAAKQSARRRFTREAKAVAAIEHDNIIAIHHVDEFQDVPFLVMPFLRGESLRDYLQRNRKPHVEFIYHVAEQLAAGLDAAHEQGLIHRDIKPSNIWLEDAPTSSTDSNNGLAGFPRVKILDFGLARSVRDDVRITREGALLGTPAYMAPEQAASKEAGPSCDLFSLGCVLYEMCTGELPFQGDDVITVLMAIANHDPTPPAAINPDIPADVSDLIGRLLSKNPKLRPPSAASVGQAIRSIRTSPDNAGERSTPRPFFKKWAVAIMMAIVIAIALFATIPFWPQSQATDEDAPTQNIANKRANAQSIPKYKPGSPAYVLTSPEYTWSKPVPIGPPIHNKTYDTEPSISFDNLTLYFCSKRPGGVGTASIWTSHRKRITSPWSAPVPLSELVNSSSGDASPEISADGKTLIFHSTREGGHGEFDLWMSTRPNVNAEWLQSVNLGPKVNSRYRDYGPTLSADGRTLIFCSTRKGGFGGRDLWQCLRNSVDEPFGPPTNLGPVINSVFREADPELSHDGLVLYWSGFREPRPGGCYNIWMSCRESLDKPWRQPIHVGVFGDTDRHEQNPDLSADGRTLFFTSFPQGKSLGNPQEIYMSRRVPRQ